MVILFLGSVLRCATCSGVFAGTVLKPAADNSSCVCFVVLQPITTAATMPIANRTFFICYSFVSAHIMLLILDLITDHCLLLTAYCLLLTAYRLPLTAYRLLNTEY